MAEATAAIQVADLAKVFPDGTMALDGVTFDVPRGQVVALLGPSGAGKTTLLRCINRLVLPTRGSVRVAGVEITGLRGSSLRAARRRIGMIFQQFHLVPVYSALDNVLIGRVAATPTWRVLSRRFRDEDVARARALLAEVGLEEKALVRAADLSGGQQQRVAIARALAQDPDVLLADEPASSLDPFLAQTVLELLRTAAQSRGLTLLLNLHSTEQARHFSDRIIALRAGRVVLDRGVADVDEAALDELYRGRDATREAEA